LHIPYEPIMLLQSEAYLLLTQIRLTSSFYIYSIVQ
jgi:hypothetical protein